MRHYDSFAQMQSSTGNNGEKHSIQNSDRCVGEYNEQLTTEFLLEMSDVDLPLLPPSPGQMSDTEALSPLKVKKPRKNPNLSWLYRKQELQALRNESKALHARLAELHKPERLKIGLEGRLLQKSLDSRADLRRQLQEHKKKTNALSKVLTILEGYCQDRGYFQSIVFQPPATERMNPARLGTNVFSALNKRIMAQHNTLEAVVKEHWPRGSVLDDEEVKITKMRSSERYQPKGGRGSVEADLIISSLRNFVNSRYQFLEDMVLLSGEVA